MKIEDIDKLKDEDFIWYLIKLFKYICKTPIYNFLIKPYNEILLKDTLKRYIKKYLIKVY